MEFQHVESRDIQLLDVEIREEVEAQERAKIEKSKSSDLEKLQTDSDIPRPDYSSILIGTKEPQEVPYQLS